MRSGMRNGAGWGAARWRTPNHFFTYWVGVLPGSLQPGSASDAGWSSPASSRTSFRRCRPSRIWSASDPTLARAETAFKMSSRFNLGPQGRAGPSRRYAVRRPPRPPARCSRRRPCTVTARGTAQPGARGTRGSERNSSPGERHGRSCTSSSAAYDAWTSAAALIQARSTSRSVFHSVGATPSKARARRRSSARAASSRELSPRPARLTRSLGVIERRSSREISSSAPTTHSGMRADFNARAMRWWFSPQAFWRARSSLMTSTSRQSWTTHSIGMPSARARTVTASSDLPSSASLSSTTTRWSAWVRHISANLVP